MTSTTSPIAGLHSGTPPSSSSSMSSPSSSSSPPTSSPTPPTLCTPAVALSLRKPSDPSSLTPSPVLPSNPDSLASSTAALSLNGNSQQQQQQQQQQQKNRPQVLINATPAPSPAEVASLLSNISPEVHARIEAFQNSRNFNAKPSSARGYVGGEMPTFNSSPSIAKPSQMAYKATIPDYSNFHSSSSSASSVSSPSSSASSPSAVTSTTSPLVSSPQTLANSPVSQLHSPPFSGPLYNPTANLGQKPSSLSARRGFNLNSTDGSPGLKLSLNSPNNPTSGNGDTISRASPLRLDLDTNSSTPSSSASFLSGNGAATSTSTPDDKRPPSSSSMIRPAKSGLKLNLNQEKSVDIFSTHFKYIDIKTGSLNFAGKASLHSKGIDFSSGSKFRISLEEFEPLGELGRGNYGTVTKVLHKPTNIIMAMKEIRLELEESKFLQIIMELEVLHKCVSPYIVDFYGAFFVEGAVYLCMEYMDGGSLDKIYQGGVDEPYLAVITDSVIRGLRQLKEKHNIIHRDVKPTNILVNTQGKVKLCDFGVSGNLVASIAKTNIGCQSYMAPERIKAANPDDVLTYTAQSDIWSLGLSVLEVAKGCYPYPPETYSNLFSQLSAIIYGDTPTLPPERFSPEARSFVANCLNKSPILRPTYGKLLAHPWLKKYADTDVNLGGFVRDALKRNETGTAAATTTPSAAVPPLHKGRRDFNAPI